MEIHENRDLSSLIHTACIWSKGSGNWQYICSSLYMSSITQGGCRLRRLLAQFCCVKWWHAGRRAVPDVDCPLCSASSPPPMRGNVTWAAFRVRLWGASESTPRGILAEFAFRVCLRGVSNFRVEAKGSSKMTHGSANENCSFNCKWQPLMEAAIF